MADAEVYDIDDTKVAKGEERYENGPGVQADSKPVEDPIDPATADSDQQLERDEKDAIDESNVISERTRGAGPKGGYTEPGDEEGLPGPDDGTSAVRGGPN